VSGEGPLHSQPSPPHQGVLTTGSQRRVSHFSRLLPEVGVTAATRQTPRKPLLRASFNPRHHPGPRPSGSPSSVARIANTNSAHSPRFLPFLNPIPGFFFIYRSFTLVIQRRNAIKQVGATATAPSRDLLSIFSPPTKNAAKKWPRAFFRDYSTMPARRDKVQSTKVDPPKVDV